MRRFALAAVGCSLTLLVISGQVASAATIPPGFAAQRDARTGRVVFLSNTAGAPRPVPRGGSMLCEMASSSDSRV